MHLSGDIKIRIGQASETGPKDKNEDTLGVRIPVGGLLATKGITAVISDGVSAATAAKEASESSVFGFLNDYYETPESWAVKNSGHRVISALNRWLFSQGLGHTSSEKGCVCTFTAIILKSHTGHIFHIGDSRLYRLNQPTPNKPPRLEQLTTDHTSKISESDTHLTRALGLEQNPQVDYQQITLQPGDRLLLTTDGIHETLTQAKIQEILTQHPDPQTAADTLSAEAQTSKDNRSCLVLDIDTLPDQDRDEVFRRLTSLPFPPDLEPGMELDGLRIDNTLTATKNTQLYLVTEINTGRKLVMKTPSITFSDNPSYLERFALEEWIGLRTQHLNLVRVIKPEQQRTHCYYLLEHIPGITLTQWSKTNPNAPLDDIIAIVSQIISGTRALHRKDTLHQDIKPDNILIQPGPTVKIIDYGSCHIGGISEINSPFERQSALGTIDYSAPEYRYGARPNRKSDLFSIAAVTYYLISKGHHPYGDNWHKANTYRDFTHLKYQSATRHNPMIPLWFDAALKKSLAPSANARHESMSEFLNNLQQPDYNLLNKNDLPFLEKDPVAFWKITSAILFIALILALIY